MTHHYHSKVSPLAPIVFQAQRELLAPDRFYRLCRQFCQQSSQKQLYFCTPPPHLIDLKNGIGTNELRKFLDRLANLVRCSADEGHYEEFYIKRVWIALGRDAKTRTIRKKAIAISKTPLCAKGMKIEVEIAGAGMIGRVARLRINDGQDLAFKAFFDPEFVWQHGPWAEIPIGIRLKYCQVTKDMPEFLFASQDWAVWEWIYPHTKPQSRLGGITYEEFAQQEGLTKLNPLNISNYNPHYLRLDPGGIAKEYRGRRLQDLLRSVIFYLRKARREGLKSLTPYLSPKMARYLLLRFVALFH
ncbi:MAG TPA: hypothetical protein DDZ80_31550 [Cyanobacteria bacterium UBA8803]|nr:hypothetical protein [Cyanobacteria bacterium UBA9273]HBL62746.1 hypothetical protein [Cyanobacteria bacterium UBA8803]